MIYLDYAAASPLDPRVLQAMQPFLTDQFYNPSANYSPALKVRQELESARSKIAHWLGARSSEIIFTAGGTEANNLAIHGVMRQFPEANILVSAIEHESVLAPARQYNFKEIKVKDDGSLNLEDLESKIDDQTVMISVGYANNEIGTVQTIREISKIIAAKRSQRPVDGLPLYFHTDAAQAANYLDLHTARLGVDLMSVNGGKIYGPKQSGFLYVKAGTRLVPLIVGGGQEKGLRSGTENPAAAAGLAVAIELAQTMRHDEVNRLQKLQIQFIKLLEDGVPEVVVNGSRKYRLPNNVHVTFPGFDNERLLIKLDQDGVQAAAGSACSASDEEPSHVLKAIGLSNDLAQSSLRFTMGRSTKEEDIVKTADLLRQYMQTG